MSSYHAWKTDCSLLRLNYVNIQQHERNKEACPAYGKTCVKCKKKNHFTCRATYKKASTRSRVYQVEEESPSKSDQSVYSSDESDVACVTDICTVDQGTGPLYAEMSVENMKQHVSFQIDCGATVNVIHTGLIGDIKLKPTKTVLRMYNKSLIYPLGKCRINLINPVTSRLYRQTFQVVEQPLVPLLSRAAAENMNLITVNYDNFKQVHSLADTITGTFKSVFEETTLGTLPGNVHLIVDENAKPTQYPPRRVPVVLKKPLNAELWQHG